MKSKLSPLIGFIVGAMGVIAGAAPQPSVGPKMLLEGGDCLGDEVLAWERLRAERAKLVAKWEEEKAAVEEVLALRARLEGGVAPAPALGATT